MIQEAPITLPLIAIAMATYNGQRYLAEQLDSILSQNYKNWILIVRDDFSDDDSVNILMSYASTDSRIKVIRSEGGKLGAAGSFLLLLNRAKDTGAYFMFCDQDDLWHQNRLQIFLDTMLKAEAETPNLPILVHSDLRLVDEAGKVVHKSFWIHGKLDPRLNRFSRLLVQNTVTGCATMINRSLASLVCLSSAQPIVHDWWVALTASALGRIVILPVSTIDYRQHGRNVIGAQVENRLTTIVNIFRAIKDPDLIKQRRRVLVEEPSMQAERFLDSYRDLLSEDAHTTAKTLVRACREPSLANKYHILKSHVIRQGIVRTLIFLMLI